MASNHPSWINSKSIAIAARIPHDLYSQIEKYGKIHFPQEDNFEKTSTIIDLIRRGLENSNVEQPVKQPVKQEIEELVKQIVKQELENYSLKDKINSPPKTGLTHAELARQLGVSSSTISRWSTGKRNPPEDLKYRFDRTLKLWIKNDT